MMMMLIAWRAGFGGLLKNLYCNLNEYNKGTNGILLNKGSEFVGIFWGFFLLAGVIYYIHTRTFPGVHIDTRSV